MRCGYRSGLTYVTFPSGDRLTRNPSVSRAKFSNPSRSCTPTPTCMISRIVDIPDLPFGSPSVLRLSRHHSSSRLKSSRVQIVSLNAKPRPSDVDPCHEKFIKKLARLTDIHCKLRKKGD